MAWKNTIDPHLYWRVHAWLQYRYGKATKCENPECPQKSNNYSWALLKGKKYGKKRENFIQLCYSCHAKYDFTEHTRELLRKINKNKIVSKETRQKHSNARLGKPLSEETKRKISKIRLERKKRLGYLNSPETREKIRKARIGKKLTEEAKRKVSEARKGKPTHKWTIKSRKKLSESLKRFNRLKTL